MQKVTTFGHVFIWNIMSISFIAGIIIDTYYQGVLNFHCVETLQNLEPGEERIIEWKEITMPVYFDNIMIERWFRSFKYEEAYLTQYNNIREARKAIGKYVHTYNFERCHSALNNQTPASCYYPILLLDDHAA